MEKSYEDTICAPATVAGTGAVSLIRVSGAYALAVCGKVVKCRRPLEEASGHTVHFGTVMDGDSPLDDVLVSVFRGPHSYTGEDCAEIGCHSSSYIVSRILELLCAAGCRMAGPGEFTKRAFLAGKMDLAQAEAVADVIASSSAAANKLAMNQLKGRYSSELRELRDRMLELSVLLELELDFSEEEVEFAERSRLRALVLKARDHCSTLADSFRTGNAIKNGVMVAIVGAPNSGKSTLLNAFVGDERAIVSDIPGTTRDTIEESCIIDGVLFRFVDTAGIRKAADDIERQGIERTYREMDRADIVIGVIDGTLGNPADEAERLAWEQENGGEDTEAFTERETQVGSILSNVSRGQKLILVANKADSFAFTPLEGALAISARDGSGLDELRRTLRASVATPDAGSTVVTNARHAEALRKAAESLTYVLDGIDTQLPGDLLAEDLRSAISSVNCILGESIEADEVLGGIFGRFCIGK